MSVSIESWHVVSRRSTTEYRKLTGNRLFVADVAGDDADKAQLWASNSYWMVPAYRVAPLLSHYNLELEVGRFEVNGSVARQGGDAPNMAALLPDVDALHDVVPAMVAGKAAYVRNPATVYERKAGYLAIFEAAGEADRVSPTVTAVNVDYLDFIVDGRDGIVFRQESPLKPLCVYVRDVIRNAGKPDDVIDSLAGLVIPVKL